MAAAVEEDYPPSHELIMANEQLAAWEAVLGVDRVSSFPVTVSVALTEVCNARCSFCAYVPERVAKEHVTLAEVQRADWLKFCKTFTPNGGGLGEPFAHPECGFR
jgi:MoaA/NifB/PqqE/SkfB family radical SAM enzyme